MRTSVTIMIFVCLSLLAACTDESNSAKQPQEPEPGSIEAVQHAFIDAIENDSFEAFLACYIEAERKGRRDALLSNWKKLEQRSPDKPEIRFGRLKSFKDGFVGPLSFFDKSRERRFFDVGFVEVDGAWMASDDMALLCEMRQSING